MVFGRIRSISLVLLFLTTGAIARPADYMPRELVVSLAPNANLTGVLNAHKARVIAQSAFTRAYRLAIDPSRELNVVASKMRADPQIRSASLNYVSNAPEYSDEGRAQQWTSASQWTSTFSGDDGPTAYQGQYSVPLVNYHAAAALSDGSGVLVAILDTGLSMRQCRFAEQVTPGWNFVDSNENTDDCPSLWDDYVMDAAAGHGTMVTGIVARFAPKAQFLPVRVLNSDGWGTLWDVVEGIRYAVARHARVLNISLGFQHNSGDLTEAINDASASGAILIGSAGNANSQTPAFPAGNPRVLTVAGLDQTNVKAAFSSYGAVVDVCAPAVKIVSTFWDGTFMAWSGTSFAAPIAAAEAALLYSLHPDMTSDQVRQTIIGTSHSVNDWNPDYFNQLGKGGAGSIDFDLAVCGPSQ